MKKSQALFFWPRVDAQFGLLRGSLDGWLSVAVELAIWCDSTQSNLGSLMTSVFAEALLPPQR